MSDIIIVGPTCHSLCSGVPQPSCSCLQICLLSEPHSNSIKLSIYMSSMSSSFSAVKSNQPLILSSQFYAAQRQFMVLLASSSQFYQTSQTICHIHCRSLFSLSQRLASSRAKFSTSSIGNISKHTKLHNIQFRRHSAQK